MPSNLKEYNYASESLEFIEHLRSLSYVEGEEYLIKYWKDNADKIRQSLDGFHLIISKLLTDKSENASEDLLKLPIDLFEALVKEMIKEFHFFGYDNAKAFFTAVDSFIPSIYSDPDLYHKCLDDNLKKSPEKKSSTEFNFPEVFDDSVKNKFKELCEIAQSSYLEISECLQTIHRSQKVLMRFNKKDPDICSQDVEIAKEIYIEAKNLLNTHAKKISQGMLYIHKSHLFYPDQLTLLREYNHYLAKFLTTFNTKEPVENFVSKIADEEFSFDEKEFVIDSEEELKGITIEKKQKLYKEELSAISNKLECRYRKNLVLNQIKKGVPKSKIIQELVKLASKDPDDLKTHIMLAKLLAEHYLTIKDMGHRMSYKEQALSFCETAFSKIDAYLDLQNIDNVTERDQTRVKFIKQISAIRNPIVKGVH